MAKVSDLTFAAAGECRGEATVLRAAAAFEAAHPWAARRPPAVG